MNRLQKHGNTPLHHSGAVGRWNGVGEGRRLSRATRGARRYDRWTVEEVELLGRLSDADLARLLGRSVWSIQLQRRKFGILGPDRPIRRWTGEEEALLGFFLDGEVARLIGRTILAVRIRRRELGIPPIWNGGAREWTGEEIEILLAFPAREAARQTGRSVGAVKSKRFKLRNDQKTRGWTTESRAFA